MTSTGLGVLGAAGTVFVWLVGSFYTGQVIINTDRPVESMVVKVFAQIAGLVLPYLANFDLKNLTVYHEIAVPTTQFAANTNAVHLGAIWGCLALALAYGIAYTTFALSAGMWSFQSRELGGAEG